MAKTRGLGKGVHSLFQDTSAIPAEAPASVETEVVALEPTTPQPANDTSDNPDLVHSDETALPIAATNETHAEQDAANDPVSERSGDLLVSIDDLHPNPYQPRRAIDDAALASLADSIKQHGMIQPILVRETSQGLEIVAGERRWRAARQAELTEVPIRKIELSDERSMELALVENIQREDLNAVEIALGIQEMVNKLGITHDEAAKKLGMSRAGVTNKLRLLQLPQPILSMVEADLISEGHARTLLPLDDPETMKEYADMILSRGLNVRQLEELVRRHGQTAAVSNVLPAREPEPSEFQEEIDRILNNYKLSVKVAGSRRNMGLLIKGLKRWQVQLILEFIENHSEELFPGE